MKWINAKDKKPIESSKVLCSYENYKNKHSGFIVATFVNGGFYAGGSYSVGGVTHWMQLPEPPKD
ncbi:TMhelix containing protein [Vibrio phage 1.189.B._10N.286.51.B5]|nr:TMhelix containing protein [Vibrio phage 1.189.B._10N.286.51.B5]AUR93916.1 TMhelix containing protein [Vibrio phage 1.189.C._10N.286.51.B5]AUR93982.1 TMhelix containing protein [Vibrio phage 1.189.O._10N.286.51.B5]